MHIKEKFSSAVYAKSLTIFFVKCATSRIERLSKNRIKLTFAGKVNKACDYFILH